MGTKLSDTARLPEPREVQIPAATLRYYTAEDMIAYATRYVERAAALDALVNKAAAQTATGRILERSSSCVVLCNRA